VHLVGFYSVLWTMMHGTVNVKSLPFLDDWLTVHRSIILVDLQLDAQNSYLFTHNTFIKIFYTFGANYCDSIDTRFNHIRRIYLKFYHYQFSIISNAANCNTVILDNSIFTEWRYQRLHIYNYDVHLLMMSRAMFETCRGV
jgi:hypothetical protein